MTPVALRIVNDISYVICDKDQSWESFFVASAVFREFGQ